MTESFRHMKLENVKVKKTLVILAAGIGSRFGTGIKQLTPVDDHGHLIIDYSIHDAIVAGFNKIIFIIRHDIEEDFRDVIGDRIEKICRPLDVEIAYAFQETSYLPSISPKVVERCKDRTKPWGTGHAVLCADDVIDSPFAVINADDYYGREGFVKATEFLGENYGLVGYILKNTLSEHGGVTRGICKVDEGKLSGITETRNIVKVKGGAEANGQKLDVDALVSMNFWCYPMSFLDVLKTGFSEFLAKMNDPMKDEYLLPIIADGMMKDGTEFTVLPTEGQWFGVTYQEDRAAVVVSFRKLIKNGVYKADLYSDL